MKALAALLVLLALPAAAQERRSGYAEMGAPLRSMQDDDSANPAMLWVMEGEALWQKPEGAAGRSCASCHGGLDSMKGVAARYPAWGGTAVVDLDQRINQCRTEQQQAEAFAPESRPLLALGSALAKQSRGQPIAPPADQRVEALRTEGARLFTLRQGQLNLSCASCHEDNAGRKLAAVTVPQAHPTGYPIYRLEWQSVGSLQRRLRNCMTGMRAEPYPFNAPELVALEAFLMGRAGGMAWEGPAVRP
jgi:sulfur-oxidizing protein SoxA